MANVQTPQVQRLPEGHSVPTAGASGADDAASHLTEQLQTKLSLSEVLTLQRKHAEAETLLRGVLAQRRQQLASTSQESNGNAPDLDNDHIILRALNNLATARKAIPKPIAAETTTRQDLATAQQTHPAEPDHPDVLRSMHALADVLTHELPGQDKLDEAEELQRRCVAGWVSRNDREHPQTLGALNNLGDILGRQRKVDEAEAVHREVLAARREIFRRDGGTSGARVHPLESQSLNNLAAVLDKQPGREGEAESMYREAIEKDGDERVSDKCITMGNLARMYTRLGRYDEAEALYRDVLIMRAGE